MGKGEDTATYPEARSCVFSGESARQSPSRMRDILRCGFSGFPPNPPRALSHGLSANHSRIGARSPSQEAIGPGTVSVQVPSGHRSGRWPRARAAPRPRSSTGTPWPSPPPGQSSPPPSGTAASGCAQPVDAVRVAAILLPCLSPRGHTSIPSRRILMIRGSLRPRRRSRDRWVRTMPFTRSSHSPARAARASSAARRVAAWPLGLSAMRSRSRSLSRRSSPRATLPKTRARRHRSSTISPIRRMMWGKTSRSFFSPDPKFQRGPMPGTDAGRASTRGSAGQHASPL